ncbi:MAG: C40 family peptidase, partial [Hymenobacteraceae bacterium]|nr:C40 family peptidase [Hymenobacteraceae bacterium]MDX5396732.1 C40 family peptidase [Hymenobacteraceae bacterium]MDX5444392.1 C40 family peptidase [Hymenobacteraceae bacterium]MDX5512792.1 C40 family peptidase [Hymenobacteraceae bacterium]
GSQPTTAPASEKSNFVSVTEPDSVATDPVVHHLTRKERFTAKADSIIQYAKQHLGTEYVYGGISYKGFDCSGFTSFVFKQFDIDIPHSSALQALKGKKIAPEKARKGDLIVFTGTNAKIRKPGHVGIVISGTGEPIRFVHASSVGGVKISEVEGTRYSIRFLEIRRLL